MGLYLKKNLKKKRKHCLRKFKENNLIMANIFCIECGFELPSTAKFCKKCGVQIEASESPSESKPITQTPIKTTPKTIESKAMS